MELCERTECQIDFSAGDKRVPPLVKITDIAQEFHVDSPAAQTEPVFAQQSFQSTSMPKLMRKSASVSSNSSTDDNFTFLPEDLANLDVYADTPLNVPLQPVSLLTTTYLDSYRDPQVALSPAYSVSTEEFFEFDYSINDGNFNTPDSGSSASNGSNNPKNFVPCKVCGDKASGYHYGVTSCEGCKGFFRRSIQKQIEYRCLRDGKCMVFRLNRNRCQYCRFKKCLAVGMSRDSVRYGRVPKRSRDRMNDDSRVSSMTGDSEQDAEIERKQLALYDIILSVSQAHHSNCAYTDDKMKNLQHRPMHFPLERCIANENDPIGSTELLEQQKVVMWETLASHTTSEIQRVVEFAKRIPGFTDSLQDDQLILIKAGFFEVWLVRISRMFAPQHGTVTLADGQYVTRDQLELIYNPELVMAMLNFSVSFNNLHLNDGEIGLFTAIVLLTADRPSLNDPKAVEQLQEKLIEALKLQLSRSHSSDPQVFPNLLLKLSELRSLGAKHNDVLGWYRMNWRRLKLPPLYAEIYDIPKGEEGTVGSCVSQPQPPQQPISINTNGCSLSPATTPGTPGSLYQGSAGVHDMMMGNLYGGMNGNGHHMMSSIGPSLGLI